MVRQPQRRLIAAIFSIALLATLGVFTYRSAASPALINIYTDRGLAACSRNGQQAPAVFQGGRFQLKLSQFWDENVLIDMTFPDGRIFTIPASQLLDGVIDQVINNPSASLQNANIAGEVSAMLTASGRWPYGCYIFTGRGLSSGKVGSTALVVIPGGAPAQNPGTARAGVTLTGSNATSGPQGSRVDINGAGFLGYEPISIWATAPDGTVINFPPGPTIVTDASGDFQTAFTFDGANPIGQYVFTILGTISNYRIFSPFSLTSPPVTQRGWATLRVAYPADQADPQRSFFEVQGTLFAPNERVDIWITLPDGAVRGLPSQFADEVGDFFAVLYLDERLPTGFYQATAKGANSNHLVITGFTLQQNSGTLLNPDPGPEVVETSDGANPAIPGAEPPFTGSPPETTNPNNGDLGNRLP